MNSSPVSIFTPIGYQEPKLPFFSGYEPQQPLPSLKFTQLVTDIIAIAADLLHRIEYHGREVTLKIISDQDIHPSFYKIRENFRKIKHGIDSLKNPISKKQIKPLFKSLIAMRRSMVHEISILSKKILGSNFILMNGPFKDTGISCFKNLPPEIDSENIVCIDTLRKMERIFRILKENKGSICTYGNKYFKKQVARSFKQILSYPNGKHIIKALLNKRIAISIKSGENDKIFYGFPHFIHLNCKDSSYQFTLIDKKMYSYFRPQYIVLMHELIHALHHSNNFSKEKKIITKNPNFDLTHKDDWTNPREAAAIGMEGDTDPFTENNFSGARGTLPIRYGHKSLYNITQLTEREKFFSLIDNNLDGDIEYLLKKKPHLLQFNTALENYELLAFSQNVKNKSLERLLVLLNCPKNVREALFEDFKISLKEENIDQIKLLIENYGEFFNYEMLIMMQESELFNSEYPNIKEFMNLLYLRLFPSLFEH